MPVHLFWGDDSAARERAVEALIASLVDPSWSSLNLSRLDGNTLEQAGRALEEARTPPFGAGARLVLLQRSPFCDKCPPELASQLEASLPLIGSDVHLVLESTGKPDARLRTTKALRAVAEERSFALPPVWDGAGQVELVQRTAQELNLRLDRAAAIALADAIGNDSTRLSSELEKLSLYVGEAPITAAAVEALIGSQATSSLQVGDALLEGRVGDAIALVDTLLRANEPALRIVASLTSQVRGLLWVGLLERSGEQDVTVIAKAAGIGNPKRIYVLRKQIRGRSASTFLTLLSQLLEVEAALKRGVDPGDAFRDGFLLPPGPTGTTALSSGG